MDLIRELSFNQQFYKDYEFLAMNNHQKEYNQKT